MVASESRGMVHRLTMFAHKGAEGKALEHAHHTPSSGASTAYEVGLCGSGSGASGKPTVIRHRWVKKIKSKVKRKGGFILSGLSKRLTFLLILFSLLFAIVACNRGGSQTVSAKDDGVIQSYLDQKVLSPLFGGKVFSAHKVLGTAEGKVYVWALLQEYYKKDNKLEMGTGWSVPLVLTVQNGTNGMVVSEHKYPGDGSLFTTDVKSLFPKGLQQEIFDFPSTQNSRDLENQAKIRAEQWAKQ